MPTRFFQVIDVESQQVDAGTAAAQNRAPLPDDEAVARRLASIGDKVPWLDADAAHALALGGIDGDSPDIAKIAQAAGKAKSKRGFGWHTIGDAVTSPGRSAVGKWVGSALGAGIGVFKAGADATVKPALRTVDTVATSLAQAQQGEFRAAVTGDWKQLSKYGAAALAARNSPGGMVKGLITDNKLLGYEAPTTAAVALEQQRTTGKMDLGSGYFAGGTAKTEQTNRARAGGTVDGRAITPGRWTASTVLPMEPGTTSYNLLSGLVDAGASWFGDPTVIGGKAVGVVRKSDKLFFDPNERLIKDAAGLVHGNRRDVMPDRANAWLTSEPGRKTVEFAADADFNQLRDKLGKKVDAHTLVSLADAKTTDEVLDVLRPRLGITINQKPTLPGAVPEAVRNVTETVLRRPLKDIRITKEMPGHTIDLDDVDGSIGTVEKFAQNALLPAETRNKHVEAMARANGRIGRYQVVKELLQDTTEHLGKSAGVDAKAARQLTRMFEDYDEGLRAYFLNEMGQNMPVVGAKIDGQGFVLPTPHRYAEYVNRALPLPDARHIRNATTKWGRILSTRDVTRKVIVKNEAGEPIDIIEKKVPLPIDQTVQVAEWLTSDVFKKLVLLRPAYPVRVIAEEQFRMAGAQLNSLWNHPISAIAYITGRKGHLDFTGDDIVDQSRLADDIDEFASAMSRSSDHYDRTHNLRGDRRKIRLGDLDNRDDFVEAWADDLLKGRSDEPTRRVLGDWNDLQVPEGLMTGNNVDKTKWWFREGPGRQLREELGQAEGREGLLTDPAVMDEYIDSLMQRADISTQGDPKLLEALATGKLNGKPIRENLKPTDEFLDYLREQADMGVAPGIVHAPRKQGFGGTSSAQMAEHWDRATGAMFNALASKPTNYLSRSSSFKQFMWEQGEQLMPYIRPDDQATMLDSARKAKLGKKQIANLENGMNTGYGDLTLEEAMQLAKLHAANKTKNLLFDYTKRGQFFDAYKLIFPFGDAWKEVLTSWAKITNENPQVVRRGQQIITGLRGADPDADGKGFFYKDPTTGMETFAYPGSKWVNEQLLGLPIPMTAPVQGLNIFGTVLPGTGPVVQFAAGSLLPDIPQWDAVHKMVFPFGEVDREQGGVVESYWPAWVQKLRQSDKGLFGVFGQPDERLFNNTVMDVQSQLYDQGRYDPNNPDEAKEAFEKARDLAQWLYVIRGFAQSTVPSPPSPEFLVKNQDGRLVAMDMLISDLHAMRTDKDAGGYSTANERFLEKYGVDALMMLSGKTKSSFPATKAGRDWKRSHGELSEKYPEVYGYFAPKDDEFDYDAYAAQLRSGEREALTPEQVQEKANSMVASIIWQKLQKQVEGRTDDAAVIWKRDNYDELIKTYPGFGRESDPNKNRAHILALQDAVKEPAIARTDAGKGLALYLEARTSAIETARKQGVTKLDGNKGAAYLRQWLRDTGTEIVKEHPDFGDVYERVLLREIEEKETS